ncbi:MAG TPA: hypothetical protein VNF07_13420 [Acidimicrobiales bacterium]|nr:hypothetical protein [Acidimicrobiales bacterium]
MASEEPTGNHQDLANQLAHRVEELVDLIRDHSLRPLLKVSTTAISALAALVIALGVLLAIGVGLLHLVDQDIFRGRVWAGDFLIGGMLGAGGLFLLRMSAKVRRDDVVN